MKIIIFFIKEDCSICLGHLYLDPFEDDIPNQNEKNNQHMNSEEKHYIDKRLIKKKKVFKTPCNHLFHVECLHQWVEVKLECPQCRCILPSCY